jgi:hypothetical protein
MTGSGTRPLLVADKHIVAAIVGAREPAAAPTEVAA